MKRTLISMATAGALVGFLTPGCSSDSDTTTSTTCTPTQEVCDGIDNNCNGLIDEDLSRDCTDNNQAGTQTCDNGTWGTCQPKCVPTAEICDGIDNDCDGRIDVDTEGNPITKECKDDKGVTGTQVCTNSSWGPCVADCAPSPEICDGLDNDCDGLVDEDEAGQPLKQDCSNACGFGSEICVNGKWESCTARQPEPEVCDGVDNDCDGEVDEGFECAKGETANCGTDIGECEFGTKVCGAACTWGECLGGVTPQTEACEGSKDEDCDGTVDNGCACVNGEMKNCCGGTKITCANGIWPSCPPPPEEVCNGLDDNCNDLVDDGLPVIPYQADEDITGLNDCNHAFLLGDIPSGKAKSYTHHLYKPDLSEDRDFFYFRATETGAFCNPLTDQCLTLEVSMTQVPDGTKMGFCVYDVGWENASYTCAKPLKKTCTTAASPSKVIMKWDGFCGLSDDNYFYLEVFYESGSSFSCKPYTFNIKHHDVLQEQVCAP